MAQKPPKHLSAEAAKLWRSLVAEYSIDDAAGLALLLLVCESLDRMRAAQAIIAEHGLVVATGDGGVKSNPAANIERDAKTQMLASLKALNLDVEPLRDRGRPPAVGWRG